MPQSARKRITMATVAERAGVARTTVSFVLNGRYREHGISEDTAARIRRVAAACRFVPNEMARSLSRQRTGMLGVFVPGFNTAWGEGVIRGVRTRLAKDTRYVPLIAAQHDQPDYEERELRLLIERQVEAIMCCPTVKTENYRLVSEHGIPLVFIGHQAPGMPEASFSAWDGPRVAAAAVRHLIARGRRRIAFAGRGQDSPTSEERYRGYAEALREAGLEVIPEWRLEVPDWRIRAAETRIDSHINGPDPRESIASVFRGRMRPDALLTDLWITALMSMEKLDELGLAIPKDVALLSLGDSPLCRHRRFGLSVVVEPAEQVGWEAADIALNLIANPGMPPVHRLIGEYSIVDRATT